VILKRQKNKSNRSLKVIEVIKKSISQILLKNDLPLNPNFRFPLSVVSVDLSSDLRIAYVYISTHETIDDEEIIKRLESCKKIYRLR
jgi:ribosome-binding factor A